MKNKRKNLRVLYVTVVVITCCVMLALLDKDKRVAKVDVSLLDMSKLVIPTQFVCKQETLRMGRWMYEPSRSPVWPNDYAKASGYKYQSVEWMNDDGVIEFFLIDYEYQVIAKIYYQVWNNPADMYKKEYGFTDPNTDPNIKYWGWENKLANEESTQCGSGDKDRCQQWFYMARYSTYYLYITLTGPTCSKSFEAVVKAIIEQLAIYLFRVTEIGLQLAV